MIQVLNPYWIIGGCIKSIQRGTKSVSNLSGGENISISISPINPNKSIALIDIYGGSDYNQYVTSNLLQNSIVLANSYTDKAYLSFSLSYQVVEFY